MMNFSRMIAMSSSLLVTVASGLEIGQEVCYEGYVVDTYCNAVGFFPHSTVRSLSAPETHTVHCLIDDTSCIQSGYEIVIPGDGDASRTSSFCRAYKLNAAGDEMLVKLAKSIGVCTDCDTDTTGVWVKGFRVTVKGTVQTVGNANDMAVLDVTEVLESSVGCGGANTEPDFCIYERAGLKDEESPCHSEGDYCKNLGETKPVPEDSDSSTDSDSSKSAGGPSSGGCNYYKQLTIFFLSWVAGAVFLY